MVTATQHLHRELATERDDLDHRRSVARLGMWVFLATEVLFFGGLFVGYAAYRFEYGDAFATGSRQLNVWSGSLMTALLLTGSLLMALCDDLLESSEPAAVSIPGKSNGPLRQQLVRRLVLTAMLGAAFLGLEFYEYSRLIVDGRFPGRDFQIADFREATFGGLSVEMFFTLFFLMTGLHALHMIIGVILVSGAAISIHRSDQPPLHANAMIVIGLYWHFVDIVWVFLFPLFYLIR